MMLNRGDCDVCNPPYNEDGNCKCRGHSDEITGQEDAPESVTGLERKD
jgi:hypothetical protein